MVKEWMKKADWTFTEQTGSGLEFAKENEVITIETRQYSRHYVIWDVPKEIVNKPQGNR
ncbi:hypothetical protein [Rossellomorea aquimaris]|jgi:hypothetical protein|uniref:hypothetical protein n=1 Tax=Rossellomorea aquimaris TaxID=189382 RepID=UPI0014962262|nr:hypothetical protein [Rossellomorea aquimaris]